MCSRELLLVACLGLLGGLRLTSTTTTTTLVAAMSIANQDLERYFRSANVTQNMPTMTEERILLDTYTYAYIKYTYMENNERKVVNLTEDQARYGEGKHLNVMGKLVHITDANNIIDDTACSLNIAGTGGSPTPAADTPWIALVRRGHCTFEEKVRNVYEKGAIGVIIYNDKIVMSLEKMQIKGKTRNITAVITYQNVGNEMVDILNQGNDVFVSIMTGSEGSRPVTALNRTSVLFVSVSFIVLMLISLVWLIFYYIQRFRYLQTKDQHSRQLCSVTKKAIMKIPTKTGKSSDEKDIDGDCCAICIEAYKSSDCIRVLPCKHEFHKHCIDPWLIEHRTCPMCKLDVLKFYGYVVGDKIFTTPSPQHIPASPNSYANSNAHVDGPHRTPADEDDDDSNMPVIVVAVVPASMSSALALAPATIHPSTQSQQFSSAITQSEQQQQHHHQHQHQHPDHYPDQNQCPHSSSDSSDSTSSSCSHSDSHVSDNSNNVCQNSCNINNSCCCPTCALNCSNLPPRRSSAPLVLHVSTASRQVTDV